MHLPAEKDIEVQAIYLRGPSRGVRSQQALCFSDAWPHDAINLVTRGGTRSSNSLLIV